MPEQDLDGSKGRGQPKLQGVGQGGLGSLFSASRLSWMICLVQFVLMVGLVVALRHSPGPSSGPAGTPAGADVEPYYRSNPGPWGELEYARIQIEPSDDIIPSDGHYFGPTRWFFEGYTRATLGELFSQCGLPASQRAALMDPAIWSDATNGIVIQPGDDLVLGLGETSRQRIYSVLAQSRFNVAYLWPFKSETASVDKWFAQSQLSPGTLALLKQLTYSRGEVLCFSDLPLVYPRIPTAEERYRLIKAMARTSTLLVKLRVKPGSDVDALADYWAKGQRSKDIQSLLESLTNFPGGMTIDVTHLLPRFARQRLYTFPTPDPGDPMRRWPNCNWTAMNFFHDPPDDRFYDSAVWGNELEQNYTKTRQPTFGDLIVFYRPDGFPIHMVVFIADDVVFTKNGGSSLHPWTLMKWNDLVADYTLEYSPVYIIFHPKGQED